MVNKYISKKEKFEKLGKKMKQKKIKPKISKDVSEENINLNSLSSYVYRMIQQEEE